MAAVAVVVAGCSSGGSDSAAPTTTVPEGTAGGAGTAEISWPGPVDWKPPACEFDKRPAPETEPVADSDSDHDMTSFDGTRIRIHWFPRPDADGDSPTILMGPGWGSPGDTNVDNGGLAVPGAPAGTSISGLHAAGYNVATWDPRGFGASDGTVQIDSADFEARDVSTLIDWVAAQDGVRLDDDGDPRVGMVGGSYGGGIQFVTAATDCRVDVITPSIAWNSLATSLYPDETYKAGWAKLLLIAATGKDLDEHITSAEADADATGALSQADREWFVDRGPDYLLSKIAVPTLILQGTVDNLFPLAEGVRNYVALANNDIPVAMTWFCGGHGFCDNPADPEGYESGAVLNWLAHFLDGDPDAEVVPAFQTVDQHGKVHRFDSFPPPRSRPPAFVFADEGTLTLSADGGSGPGTAPEDADIVAKASAGVAPAKATGGVDVALDISAPDALVVGAPDLGLGYTCNLEGEATRPTRIFAQLVDDATGQVVGNQITPVPIVCDGLMHQVQMPIQPVAWAPGDDGRLILQLVATTVVYAQPQLGGTVDFSRIELALPMADS